MSYRSDLSGRVGGDASDAGSVVDPRLDRQRGALLSFADIEERLVQAMLICWRNPDRERGWQQLRSAWPDVLREISAGDYDARGGDHSSSDVSLRPASLTRAEVAEMEEAFGWLDHIEPLDRKLVGLAITAMARGAKQVPWMKLRQPMGVTRGADGLRMRYERAIGQVCRVVNGGFLRPFAVNPENRP
jgi:hypothetical protein